MLSELPPALLRVLPSPPVQAHPVQGGDSAKAWRIVLASGHALFAKSLTDAPPGFFAAEANGLRWLAEAEAISVPEVLASSGAEEPGGFLVLPFLPAGPPPDRRAQERLGRQLAALHGTAAPCWGADSDNFIGRLPQRNGGGQCPSWPTLFRDLRLLPQVQEAARADRLTVENRRRLFRLMDGLSDLLATPIQPARVHGDLWSGNVLFDETGEPWLVDPAAHGGHPEVDLAMMTLFGGFGDRVFAAYSEISPLEPGWQRRRAALQLYPVLVHLNLFGTHYNRHLDPLLERLQ